MRILPILWAEEPTAEDWRRLSEARKSLGYTDLIKPVHALEGSPQPVLCIGELPGWMTDFAYVGGTSMAYLLKEALDYCLNPGYEQTEDKSAQLLSQWMGVDVKYIRTEESDVGVRFV